MKTKFLIVFSCLLLSSCILKDGDIDLYGITFSIANNTNQTYENASITIGGMKDGEFIGTESYKLPTLKIISSYDWNTYGDNKQEVATGQNRWNPNLDLIRQIPSEKAYFKLTLAGNETLLRNINYENGVLTTLVSRAIPKGYSFVNDDGLISIGIWEEGITGRLLEN